MAAASKEADLGMPLARDLEGTSHGLGSLHNDIVDRRSDNRAAIVDGWPNLTSPKPIMAADEEVVPTFMPEIGRMHYINEHFCVVIIGEGIARVMSWQSLGI